MSFRLPQTTSRGANMNANPRPPSAGSRVACIPELLEKILLEIVNGIPNVAASRALLCSQRVSRAFQDTLNGSPALQRALHFTFDENSVDDATHTSFNAAFYGDIQLADGSSLYIDQGGPIGNFDRTLRIWLNPARWDGTFEPKVKKCNSSWRRMYVYKGDKRVMVFSDAGEGNGWRNPKLGEVIDLEYGDSAKR